MARPFRLHPSSVTAMLIPRALVALLLVRSAAVLSAQPAGPVARPLPPSPLPGLSYTELFLPSARYDAAVPTPERRCSTPSLSSSIR